jgi:NADPH2:quinone reductase
MSKTYRAVMLTRKGGPKAMEVLEVVELSTPDPGPGQVRVRVRAAGVGATDLMALSGNYRYGPKLPFVPGYEIAGVVDALGPGVEDLRVGQRVAALTVYGGFGEMIVRDATDFLPIPDDVSDRDAAAVILNYVTAYQAIHRVGKAKAGQTALVTGAAGGVGTAALQLLRLAGVKTYGAASPSKHGTLRALGAIPIDYRAGRLDRLVRDLEPGGVDLVLDGIGGSLVSPCIGALRPGGRLVAYGFMGAGTGTWAMVRMFANIFLGSRLRGRLGSFYGITALYRKDPSPFREDLPKIFSLLAEKKVDPMIATTLPLLEARNALELLATGTVEGKIALEAREVLSPRAPAFGDEETPTAPSKLGATKVASLEPTEPGSFEGSFPAAVERQAPDVPSASRSTTASPST